MNQTHRADRDIRHRILAAASDQQVLVCGGVKNTLGGLTCYADHDPVARERRLQELVKHYTNLEGGDGLTRKLPGPDKATARRMSALSNDNRSPVKRPLKAGDRKVDHAAPRD